LTLIFSCGLKNKPVQFSTFVTDVGFPLVVLNLAWTIQPCWCNWSQYEIYDQISRCYPSTYP